MLKIIFTLSVSSLLIFGAGRLYFQATDGFHVTHISSDFTFDPRWETRALAHSEQSQVDEILLQKFSYLGKGCQSYVFLSEDGEYVLKFFKYQRFRPQFYFYWFAFLPPVEKYLNNKIAVKNQKRESLFASCRTAFDHLPKETGLVYVHLNKTSHLNRAITITDKVGLMYNLNMDDMEFIIQKKATMLCSTLDTLASEGKDNEAKNLLTQLIQMVTSEYHRGFADNDHALMQNTGVYRGMPIHIDIGQFVEDETVKDPKVYYQELYNKTWKFRNWLREKHAKLLAHLDQELLNEMGENFYTTEFIPKDR